MHLPQLCVKIEIFVHAYKSAAGKRHGLEAGSIPQRTFHKVYMYINGMTCCAVRLARIKCRLL